MSMPDPPVTDPGTTAETPPVVTEPPVTEPTVEVPYAKELESLPEAFRPIVEPVFQDWDKRVQERFTKNAEQYAPWQDIVKNADPETVQNALLLAEAMDSNPQALIQNIMQAYGIEMPGVAPAGSPTPPVSEPEDFGDLPPAIVEKLSKIDTLEQGVTALAQFLQGQQQTTEAQEADRQLMDLLSQLKTTHGDFDDDYVITKIAGGVHPDDAVKQYRALVPTAAIPAPTVAGGGGGVPVGDNVDIKKMDSATTKQFVVDLLAANAAAERS